MSSSWRVTRVSLMLSSDERTYGDKSYESRYGHRVRLAVAEWGLK